MQMFMFICRTAPTPRAVSQVARCQSGGAHRAIRPTALTRHLCMQKKKETAPALTSFDEWTQQQRPQPIWKRCAHLRCTTPSPAVGHAVDLARHKLRALKLKES